MKDSERSFRIPKCDGLRIGCKDGLLNIDTFEYSCYLSTAVGVVENLNVRKSLGDRNIAQYAGRILGMVRINITLQITIPTASQLQQLVRMGKRISIRIIVEGLLFALAKCREGRDRKKAAIYNRKCTVHIVLWLSQFLECIAMLAK
jgi:hypothetical protein